MKSGEKLPYKAAPLTSSRSENIKTIKSKIIDTFYNQNVSLNATCDNNSLNDGFKPFFKIYPLIEENIQIYSK